MFGKISIIGCGLIGSSILRATKEQKLATKISVYDKSNKVMEYLKKNFSVDICSNASETAKDADLTIISALNKVKPPFNVSRPALFAASAAVKDSSWLNKEIKHVNKWSKKMFSEFKKMRIETNKSFTNFLLIKFDKVKINSAKVFRLLAKSGILVRKMDVYGIKNSLRITIGTTSENIALMKKMRKILNVR